MSWGRQLFDELNDANVLSKNISTATTTLIKTGPGTLIALIVNKHVALNAVTVYDSLTATGTKLGTITPGATLLTDPPIRCVYNIPFTTGLTIVTAGASDVTVVYK